MFVLTKRLRRGKQNAETCEYQTMTNADEEKKRNGQKQRNNRIRDEE